MALQLGYNAKLYLDEASGYAAPDWSEVTDCKDVTLNLERGDADVSTRGTGGWKATVGALLDASVDFTMIWDNADANFLSIQTAFFSNIGILVAVMDGPIATAGSQGLWAVMMVSKFTRNEPLEEAMTVNVTVKPTYFPAYQPVWHTSV